MSGSKNLAGRRRALIVGPLVANLKELSQALRLVEMDPHHLDVDLCVAVDGGLLVLKRLGVRPHFAVGDWDSLGSSRALSGVLHLTLPRKKDRSDLYYACRTALAAGATELVCVGVTGGRHDHHLAMLLDLSEIASKHKNLKSLLAVDSKTRLYFLSENQKQWRGSLKVGQTVSVFSLGGSTRGVTLEGLEYTLKNATLKPSSLGLSNRVKKTKCSVKLLRGQLVVMVL